MHDLELARLIQADREREIARGLRARAVRIALADGDGGAFVPPHSDRPARVTHAVHLVPSLRGSG
jgi:hypothetical protein